MVKFVFLFTAILISSTFSQSNKSLKNGQSLPPLQYVTLDKSVKTLDWKKHKGEVFLIDFWATWCAPCIQSFPHTDSLINKVKGEKVKFISVTYEPANLVMKSLKTHPMQSEIGIDNDFAMFRKFNAWPIPNIVMINSKGVFAGRIHPNQLNEDVINQLLDGKIPVLENTKEDMFNPIEAEKYFRSFLEEQKNK